MALHEPQLTAVCRVPRHENACDKKPGATSDHDNGNFEWGSSGKKGYQVGSHTMVSDGHADYAWDDDIVSHRGEWERVEASATPDYSGIVCLTSVLAFHIAFAPSIVLSFSLV